MSALRAVPSWAVAARDLLLVAMAVFVLNIVIGILNGADAVEFDHNQILTHVHAGTVGWLTLTIVASTFLLFRAADRRLMLALAILVPVYVVAFYTGRLRSRHRRHGTAGRGCWCSLDLRSSSPRALAAAPRVVWISLRLRRGHRRAAPVQFALERRSCPGTGSAPTPRR
jgi:hypothetical protein